MKNLCERWALLYSGQELTPSMVEPDMVAVSKDKSEEKNWSLPEEGVDLAELERNLIFQALGRAAGNKSRAARLPGISSRTLDYRLGKPGIEGSG